MIKADNKLISDNARPGKDLLLNYLQGFPPTGIEFYCCENMYLHWDSNRCLWNIVSVLTEDKEQALHQKSQGQGFRLRYMFLHQKLLPVGGCHFKLLQ